MSYENNKSVLIIENDQQFEVLVYIRTKSGRVYYDEIENMFGEEKQSVTKLLKSLEDEHYLKKDEVENYVYSVPGKRDELDTELHKYAKNHSKNPYIYNKFLYYDNDKINNIKKKLNVFFDQIQTGTGSDNTPNGDLTDIDCISETEIERRLIESIKPRFVDKKYIS